MFVKICGIKSIEDAIAAAKAGADAIGMLIGQKFPSIDFIDIDIATEITRNIPHGTTPVLVTHLSNETKILDILEKTSINCVQLHSDIEANQVTFLKKEMKFLRIFKSIHVKNQTSVHEARKWDGLADALVLDSINETSGQIGGTGLTHDWNISKKIVQELKTKIILAGGLNPDNVYRAIKTVKPFCVDANSGLQNSSGFKDKEKVKKFIKAVKHPYQEVTF